MRRLKRQKISLKIVMIPCAGINKFEVCGQKCIFLAKSGIMKQKWMVEKGRDWRKRGGGGDGRVWERLAIQKYLMICFCWFANFWELSVNIFFHLKRWRPFLILILLTSLFHERFLAFFGSGDWYLPKMEDDHFWIFLQSKARGSSLKKSGE